MKPKSFSPPSERSNFYKELFSLAVPIGLQNLLVALIGASDALMLGRLTQDAVAAVSLANQIAFSGMVHRGISSWREHPPGLAGLQMVLRCRYKRLVPDIAAYARQFPGMGHRFFHAFPDHGASWIGCHRRSFHHVRCPGTDHLYLQRIFLRCRNHGRKTSGTESVRSGKTIRQEILPSFFLDGRNPRGNLLYPWTNRCKFLSSVGYRKRISRDVRRRNC